MIDFGTGKGPALTLAEDEIRSGAVIKVVGVGGAGGNALNRMMEWGVRGVEFIAVNTDAQDLDKNRATHKIQIGEKVTRGLGAGSNPEIGKQAATEDQAKIQEALEGADMVFVTAGMGGGTGTGAAPVIASIAANMEILTVGVVTRPFVTDGRPCMRRADEGIRNLQDTADAVITIPNQRLLDLCGEDMSADDAFKMADDILRQGVQGISDLIVRQGAINLDFADVRRVMHRGGLAVMGMGESEGQDALRRAAELAIHNPLLEDGNIRGAQRLLVNICGTKEAIYMKQLNGALEFLQSLVHEDADFKHGVVYEGGMGGTVRVTIVATGFDAAKATGPKRLIVPAAKVVGGMDEMEPPLPLDLQGMTNTSVPMTQSGGFMRGNKAVSSLPPGGAVSPHAPRKQDWSQLDTPTYLRNKKNH